MRIDNQHLVCEFARSLMSSVLGTEVVVEQRPDEVEREKRAVEEIWQGGGHRFAVEHTLVESFPGQLADGAAFAALLGPLDGPLDAFMPGDFTLTIPAGAASRVRAKYADVQKAIVLKLVKLAPTLETNSSIVFNVPGADFDIKLRRRDGPRRQLRSWRSVGDELEAERLIRVGTALARKCPKVVEAAKRNGALSVLLLESDDISLANFAVVTVAVRQALTSVPDRPDIVLLIETDLGSPHAWVIENTSGLGLRESYGPSIGLN